MIHNYYSASLIFLAGFCLFSAFNHFTTRHFRHQRRVDLLFAVITLSLIGTILTGIIKSNTSNVADHLTWGRVNIAFNVIMYALLPWFFALYSEVRVKLVLFGSTSLCMLLFFINLIQPNTLLYSEIHGIDRLLLPWGEEVFLIKATPSIWGNISFGYVLFVPILGLYSLTKRYRLDHRRSTLIMMFAVVLLIAALTQNVLVSIAVIHNLPPLGAYGFLSVIIIMGTTLTRELREDRKRAEEALQQSERKTRAILDQGFVFIGLMSPDGILLDANRAALELAGVNPHDVFNKPFWESPWWNHSIELQNKLRESIKLAAAGEEVRFEASHPTTHGSLRYVDFSLRPVKNEQGDILYLIPEGHDITERKMAEENLIESQRKLGTLMGNLPGIAFRCLNDADWTMNFMSEGCFNLTGFYPHELEGNQINSYGNLIHPEDATMVWQKVQDAINNHTFWQIEYRIHTKEGIEKWVWEQGCGVYDKVGNLVVLEGFISDITERKHAEKELQETHQLLKSTFASLHDAVFIIDFKTTAIIDCNVAATQIFGYSRDQIIGKTTEFLHINKDALGEFRKQLSAGIAEKGYLFLPEFNMKRKDGTIFPTEHTVTRHLDDQGVQIGWVSVVCDITERKLAEQELHESKEKYRYIVDNAPIGIFQRSIQGSFNFCNLTLAKQFECNSIEEFLLNYNDITKRWPNHEEFIEFNALLLKNGEVLGFENELKLISGKTKWFALYYKLDSTKSILDGFSLDITERKLAEQSLKESEERYKLLINNIMYPVIVSSFDGKMLYINQKTADFLGIEPSEIRNLKSPNFWVDPTKRDEFIAELKTNNVVRNKEVQFRNTNNEIITAVMSSNIIDYYGQKAIFSIYNDISQRKKAEKALQESEEKYRYIVENAPIGIFQRTLEGQYNYCNLTLANHFECESIDKFLQHYNEIPKRWVNPNKHAEFKELLVNNGKALGFEVETKLINGKTKWFSLYVDLDSSNSVLNGFSLDITERKFAERALSSLATNFAGLSGKAFFEAVSKHIATEMGLDYVYVGGLTDTKDSVRVLGGFALGEAMGEMIYSLADTPCNDVIENNNCIYTNGVQLQYPNDFLLQQMGIDGYLGARIYNKEQEPIGLLVALHSKPLNNPDILDNLFRIFLDRIAAEFNRMHAYEALKKSEEKFAKAFQSSPDLIAITSLMDGLIVDVNDRIQDILEYSREEVVGKSAAQLHIWVEPAISDGYVARLRQDGYIRDIEYKMFTKSGKIIDILASAEIIELQDKQYIFATYRDITERKKAEEEIRFQNILLKTNQELALDGILIVDEKGNILSNNKKFQEIWEIPQEVFDSKSDEKAYNSVLNLLQDPQAFLEKVEYLYRVKTEKSFDEIQLKNGKFLERYSAPMLSDLGQYFGRIWFFRDITESKKAEKTIKESNEYNRQLFSTSQIGLALAKMTGELVDINQAYADIIGYTIEETLQLTYWDITPEKYAEKEQEQLKSLYEKGIYGPYEKEYTHKNGALIPVVLSGNIIERYGEKYIWSSVENITERKKAEAILIKLYTAINYSEASIVITDMEGNIEFANPYFTQLTGYSKDEYLGKNPKVLKSGIHSDEFYKELWDTIKLGNTWEGEFCNCKKNGELYWEKAIITPLKNEKDEIINFVAVKSDITNEKKHKYLIDISLEIYEKSEHLTIEEILKYSIELGIKLTDSEIGFFHFVNADQETISLQAWSAKTMDICDVPTIDKHYPISKAGVWVDCFYQKKPVFHNDYSSLSHKKGLPEGHATLTRDLSVPVIIENQVVAIFGVGNKVLDYDNTDADFLLIFAENVWNVIRRKNAEADAIEAERRILSSIIEAEERERNRFSRDLHDGIGPLLSSIKLYFQWLSETDDPKKRKFIIENGDKNLNEALESIREISNNLSPRTLSNLGVIAALKNFIDNINKTQKLIIEFSSNTENRFDEKVEIIVYRIITELINNTVKYASAGKSEVKLIFDDERSLLRLTYSDNGKGFDLANVQAQPKGIGLTNINQRVNSLNGKIVIKSSKGKGIKVSIELPLQKN